jgi:hypothetical protein
VDFAVAVAVNIVHIRKKNNMRFERGISTIENQHLAYMGEVDAVAEAAWQSWEQSTEVEIFNANCETKEGEKSREYGAFFQVIQKVGNNISYTSRPLPRDITPEMLQRMMVKTLYPENEEEGQSRLKTFSEGKLGILSKPGINLDAVDRAQGVARSVLDLEHPDKESESMQVYYAREPLIAQELPDIKQKMIRNLFSSKPKAEVADGKHIFFGAYKYEDGDIRGLNLEGTQEFSLLDLPTTDEHREQMKMLIKEAGEHENATWILVDSGPTVGDCAEACARFFEMKEQMGRMGGDSFQQVYSALAPRFEARIYIETEKEAGCTARTKCEKGKCQHVKQKKQKEQELIADAA